MKADDQEGETFNVLKISPVLRNLSYTKVTFVISLIATFARLKIQGKIMHLGSHQIWSI